MKKIIIFIVIFLLLFLIPIRSAAEAPKSKEQPVNPPDIEELIEEYQRTFRLTIYYIYVDGSPAAPTYTEILDTGTPYSILSPTIDKYHPSIAVVEGIMPKRDVQYTVIYITEDTVIIPNYETPLGVGFVIMNLGVCVE